MHFIFSWLEDISYIQANFLKLYSEIDAKLNKAAEDTKIAFERKIPCSKNIVK